MAARGFLHSVASGVGLAADGEESFGVLDGDGSAGQEFSGDGFVANSRDSFVELFDGGRVFVRRCSAMGSTEKDNAETQSIQSRRRVGKERRRYGGNGGGAGLTAGCVSAYFSVSVLCDARGSALSPA